MQLPGGEVTISYAANGVQCGWRVAKWGIITGRASAVSVDITTYKYYLYNDLW